MVDLLSRRLVSAALLWLALSTQVLVWGAYELRIRLHSYRNPSNRQASGRCCDPFCFSDCDNIFRFCLRPQGFNTRVLSCPLGSQYAGRVGGDRIAFGDRIGRRVANPIIFRSEDLWTGSFQLLIEINDDDLFFDDFVDSIFIEPHTPLRPSQPFTDQLQFTGIHRRGSVFASFQVVCQDGFYRPDCSMFCQETEESYCDANGDRVCRENHFPPDCVLCEETMFSLCDPRGNIICRETYYNPPACETQCIPMNDTEQGYYNCSFDGSRVCLENYYGDYCTVFCKEVAEQYQCNEQGERVCENGFHGENCDVFCIESDNEFDGHFNCSESGEKICLFGFKDPTTNCTQQVCEPACELVGGFCNGTSELCQCFDGWTGQRCSECTPADGCSPEGGYCIIPGECLCREGFNGSLCQTVVDPCVLSPCMNDGTCITAASQSSTHLCLCAHNFTGSSCETNLTTVVTSPVVLTNPPEALQNSDGLSAQSIVGIVLGVLFFLILVAIVAVLLYFFLRHKRRNGRVMSKMYQDSAEEVGMPNPVYLPQVVGEHIMSSQVPNGSLLNDFQNPLYVNQGVPARGSQPPRHEEDALSCHSDSMYSTIDHRAQRRSQALRQPLIESFSSASTAGIPEVEESGSHQQRLTVGVPEEEALYSGAKYSLLTAAEDTDI